MEIDQEQEANLAHLLSVESNNKSNTIESYKMIILSFK